MKVPQQIEKAIYKCAEFNEKARNYEMKITEWMEDMKITEETASNCIRNLDDTFVDCCQVTNNPQTFIEVIENLEEE